jgi:hypothetical protein
VRKLWDAARASVTSGETIEVTTHTHPASDFYAPAGIVLTVAPAGGSNVDAGGFAEYACSVTVLPFAFTYVRTPFDVDPQ